MSFDVNATVAERFRVHPLELKLRHLRGITLRNLNKKPGAGRLHGKTIDDGALPYALKSPAKLLASHERIRLLHSRSQDDLRSTNVDNTSIDSPSDEGGKIETFMQTHPQRPKKPRRKSTFEWANSTLAERQSSFQDAIARRTADVFFSLHVDGLKEEPIYISEVVEHTTNPNFRSFDISTCSPLVTRGERATVRVWTRSLNNWRFLVEVSVDMSCLRYSGKSLEGLRRPLPDNTLIFSLHDGVYLCPIETRATHVQDTVPFNPDTIPVNLERTCSYDTLMRLAILDECIQDAVVSREKVTSDINTLIAKDKEGYFSNDRLRQIQDIDSTVHRTVAHEQRQIRALQIRLQKARTAVGQRKEAIAKGRAAQVNISEDLQSNSIQLDRSRESHARVMDENFAQRRRLCSELADIYPIEPIPDRALAFKIRNLPLPNSNFMDVSEDVISAALGHVAHVVHILSFYLSTPLAYPITPSSSTSSIYDPISVMSGSRLFPLYLHRAIFYRFEYGVFLLNKNIELLASKLGLKLIDIRQTLPNLKYVLFVATSGKGDLPSRKLGGVRGLLASRNESITPDSSRRSSFDSTTPGQATLRAQLTGKSKIENGNLRHGQA